MKHGNYTFKIKDFPLYMDYHYIEYKGDKYYFYLEKPNVIAVPDIPPFSVREVIIKFIDYLNGKNYIFTKLQSSELRFSDLYDNENFDDYKFKIFIYNYKTLDYDVYGLDTL